MFSSSKGLKTNSANHHIVPIELTNPYHNYGFGKRSDREAETADPAQKQKHGTTRLPTSHKLLTPKQRIGRKIWEKPIDPDPTRSFGDTIYEKSSDSLRIYFQNVKGLTYSTGLEDYYYYVQSLTALHIDIAGLSETNTAWQHLHLQADFRSQIRKHYRQSRVSFGFPSSDIDKCSDSETYQAGGNLTMVVGNITSSSFSEGCFDPTGLGRWSGLQFRGKDGFKLTAITAYRTCSGNIRTSPLGSTYSREYNFFRSQGQQSPNPRLLFIRQLETQIRQLQREGNAILLMLDANADFRDTNFMDMISACDLHDLHQSNPPQSTYIGSAKRRIDYMFGCNSIKDAVTRAGALSYTEGPQSDHRGLFVDIKIPELGSLLQANPLANKSNRFLYTGNPELVEAFIKSVKKYYAEHRMIQRIEELFTNQSTMTRDEIMSCLIKWDQDQGRAMHMAEDKLRVPSKKYSWSPKLRNAAIIRRYWILVFGK
ncbi:hypothetical protein MHU86_16408 [Fragilaria crotonensis]|nr:hypothetical protein MHU86_16408 [Fragilaria crotonensis]